MLPEEDEEVEEGEKAEEKEELSQCGANCHSGAVAGGAKGTFSRHSHLIDNIVAWQSPLTTCTPT